MKILWVPYLRLACWLLAAAWHPQVARAQAIAPAAGATPAQSPAKKLIEFGWDEPDTSFLRSQLAALERTPFDGCVFHVAVRGNSGSIENFSWLAWGRRRFVSQDVQPAIDDLASLPPTRFCHNFLRLNVTPADLDWFDDHAAVAENVRLAARTARAGGCDGVLLDTEQYQGKLFDFHKQKHAGTRSWSLYAAQANERGREIMAALQDGYPDLTVLLTFGPSLVWTQSDSGKKPMADCEYGLLVPFLDGMIAAARGKTRLVDGHEPSYGYRDPDAFPRAHEIITKDAPALGADPAAYHRVMSAGFGIWLDYNWPVYGWNPTDLEKNYFSPARFEKSLRAALAQSDEFVWIYTEKPRWWSPRGGAVDLPGAYVEVIRRARGKE